MKTIVFVNQKGGVGKTALSLHAAWFASEILGEKTLFIDLDGQGNTTTTLLPGKQDLPVHGNSADLFADKAIGEPLDVHQTLSLYPAPPSIDDVESMPLDVIRKPAQHLVKMASKFNYCVIDTPPQRGRRILGALCASQYAISPIFMDRYSIRGLTLLQQNILAVKTKYNADLKLIGVVRNGIQNRSRSQIDLSEQLEEKLTKLILPTSITYSTPFADAINEGRPVWKNARSGAARKASREIKAVMYEIFERIDV